MQRTLRKCEPELRQLHDEHNSHRRPAPLLGRACGRSTWRTPDRPGRRQAQRLRPDAANAARPLRRRAVPARPGRDGRRRRERRAATTRSPSPASGATCPVHHTFAFGKTTTSDRQSDVALTDITIEPVAGARPRENSSSRRRPTPPASRTAKSSSASSSTTSRYPSSSATGRKWAHKETLRLTTGNELTVDGNAPAQARRDQGDAQDRAARGKS